MTNAVILAALIASILWNLITWLLGIPSSSSHALVGGLIGAIAVGAGVGAVQWKGLITVLVGLFISPVLGLIAGFLFTRLTLFLARNARPSINWFFKRAQIFTGVSLALSHGANDAQKTMGIITLGLLVNGTINHFEIPLWVILISSTAMALGIASGGWRLIRTIGGRFFKIHHAWLHGPNCLRRRDPGSGAFRRSGQHDAGGQLSGPGGWLGRAGQQGALGCGRQYCDRLVVNHPGNGSRLCPAVSAAANLDSVTFLV